MKRYSYVRAVVSALACIVGLSSLHAQVRNDTVPRKSGIEKATLRLPDSVRLAFRRLCDGTMHPVEPTRLDVYRFNPLDKQPLPYHHLGNVGSPALALFLPYAPEKVGFRLGLNAYNLYLPASHDSLLFYDAPRAYSDVLYTQAGDKEQGNLFAQVGTNLSPTFSLGVDYRIFTQQGAFARQRVRHTHLSLAAWFHPTNGRYEGFLSGFTNVARQQESGGIANDSLLSVADFANRQSIPVRLQLAESRTEKHQ